MAHSVPLSNINQGRQRRARSEDERTRNGDTLLSLRLAYTASSLSYPIFLSKGGPFQKKGLTATTPFFPSPRFPPLTFLHAQKGFDLASLTQGRQTKHACTTLPVATHMQHWYLLRSGWHRTAHVPSSRKTHCQLCKETRRNMYCCQTRLSPCWLSLSSSQFR